MSENSAASQGNSNSFTRTGEDRRCIVCNRFLAEANVKSCPTCKTDNTGWINSASPERVDLFPVAAWGAVFVAVVLHQWGYLLLRGGWMPSVAWGAAFMESAPIGVASVVVAAIIYALRDLLRHYELKRQFKTGGWRPSLILLAVFSVIIAIAIVLAVVLLAAVAAALTDTVESANPTGSVAPVTPLISLPFLSIAIMLIGVDAYVRNLNSRFPPPIYCDTNKMCEIVLKTLGDSYLALSPVKNLPTAEAARNSKPELTPAKNDGSDADENGVSVLRAPTCLEVVSLRHNKTAGLDLTIREHVTRWERQEREVEYTAKEEATEYDISTDEWAQITHFEPRKRKIRLAIYEPDVKTGR